MWAQKTSQEMAWAKRKRLSKGLCAGVGLAALGIVANYTLGTRKFGGFRTPPEWGPERIVGDVFLLLLGGLIGLFLSSFRARSFTRICTTCEEVSRLGDGPQCACGGNYLRLDEAKWVPPAPQESNADSPTDR